MHSAPAANKKKEERKKMHPRLVGLVRLRGLALSDPLSVLLMILGYVRMGNLIVRGKVLVLALRPKSLRRRKKPMLELRLDELLLLAFRVPIILEREINEFPFLLSNALQTLMLMKMKWLKWLTVGRGRGWKRRRLKREEGGI